MSGSHGHAKPAGSCPLDDMSSFRAACPAVTAMDDIDRASDRF